jgi:hypothetical protein
MKKCTFKDLKGKELTLRPTEIVCLAGEKDAAGEKIYFIFVREFEAQGLSDPYVQIRTTGKNKIANQIWFPADVAEAIFEFFATVDKEELSRQEKEYTFTTPQNVKISFKPNLIFSLVSKGKNTFTFTLAYVKNFKDQSLQGPYVQMTENGKFLVTQTYFGAEEAKKILDFFAKSHMLGPSALEQGLSLAFDNER